MVCVLLATFDGERWLEEQLEGIFCQAEVHVHVVASDDSSGDTTPQLLSRWAARAPLHVLPSGPERMGTANRNFIRLICEAPLADAGYVALADQDDIWKTDKLARAVSTLRTRGLDAYSCDVTAFTDDNRTIEIRKSHAPRRYDYLFEAAGPGCTYVFTRAAFERLRDWAVASRMDLLDVKVHDWLIYAYARTMRWAWHIDPFSFVLYRQHERNEIGANAGLKAAWRRGRAALSGTYRLDVLRIAHAVRDTSWVTSALERFRVVDRLRLAANSGQCRRSLRDQMFLAFFFVFMRRR